MKKSYILLLLVFTASINFNAFSQEDEKSGWDASVGTDLVSRYIWRGLASSKTPALQPYLEVSNGGFAIGTWASYTIGQEIIQEIDLYVSYSIGGVTFAITDYFAYEDTLPSFDFFNFSSRSTAHLLDAQLVYEGPESFPIKATLSTLFFGPDKNVDGKNNYSTYIELGYNFGINDFSILPFAGFSVNEGFYNSKAGFINCGITGESEIKVNENFTVPISVSFITNPLDNNAFVVLMLSF
ncbi:MAG: hypothetical protein A2W99_04600 [Bacteroidetes bacterium GWF2_33_16]|nr:MAG: hypothetical protein A2X00_17120 [Bacteroidetes bacterium GWE2_32_14]OFY05948.1 MAG: hypothetical protein A2W99_04600 [Bacteroidetes bacterium GWF2_33_16]